MMKMTGEEVKNQLEELIKDRESFMVGDYDKDIYDCDKEALVFAVKAVEKQMMPAHLVIWGLKFAFFKVDVLKKDFVHAAVRL